MQPQATEAPLNQLSQGSPGRRCPPATTPTPTRPPPSPAAHLRQQLVCHESDLPGPGARLAATVADREALVVRTEDGDLAAHLNVCRHRGTRLVTVPEPSGKAIRCPYHGWTYKLDGRLVGAPEARQIPCLDKPRLGLLPVRVESFLVFVFANLDPDAQPLAEQCVGLAEAVDPALPSAPGSVSPRAAGSASRCGPRRSGSPTAKRAWPRCRELSGGSRNTAWSSADPDHPTARPLQMFSPDRRNTP
ncbi:Rieske (2Fe-2S) protein [Streptomyces sp. NBC_01794]|uniref:Rieske (2Fe-2S) protein n=1 Tax=Streptomyces sp. NBC_01794 TaxID=2975942 RepID=UPI00308B0EDE|nr:Rieske (2Fe-2S) protein [Streptomyces sp. NBC_01794]WSB05197.1 Rieske (2Fe-2S) protein [Streptomyces sp. NBC_01794]